MGWNSVRRWPFAALSGAVLLFAASLTSAAQQPAPQPSPSSKPATANASGRDTVTIVGMVPIPDVGPGAPRYTSKDIEAIKEQSLDLAFRAESDAKRCADDWRRQPCVEGAKSIVGLFACEDEYATKAANLADKATTATKAAEDVRREAAAGRASAREVEAAELKRQDAVNKMQAMREKVDDTRADTAVAQERLLSTGLWQSGERPRGSDLKMVEDIMLGVWADAPKRRQAKGKFGPSRGLRIEGVRIAVQSDKTKPTVLVQGRIRNTGEESVAVPGLVAMLLDEREWVVARQSVTPDKNFVVPAKGSKPFGLEVKFAPQAAKRAMVAFAHELEPPPRIGVGAFCPPRRR